MPDAHESQEVASEDILPVDILPIDEANSKAMMERIQTEQTKGEANIRTMAAEYQFSSPEAAQHITDGIVALVKVNGLKSIANIDFAAVNIDR